MTEQVREYWVAVEIYRDTNKNTYRERRAFESIEAAQEWLAELAEENAS